MLLYSKSTDNTDIPKDENIQRVDTYVSKIIIKPHQEFDKVQHENLNFFHCVYDFYK